MNFYVMGAVSFFKSTWSRVKCNAALLVGELRSNFVCCHGNIGCIELLSICFDFRCQLLSVIVCSVYQHDVSIQSPCCFDSSSCTHNKVNMLVACIQTSLHIHFVLISSIVSMLSPFYCSISCVVFFIFFASDNSLSKVFNTYLQK